MEDGIGVSLHRRSDGFVETPEGEFAVVMRAMSGIRFDGVKWFTYKLSVNSEEITVEWDHKDNFALFPADISRGLIAMNYAVVPNDEQLGAVLTTVQAEQPAQGTQAPAPAVTDTSDAPVVATSSNPAPAPAAKADRAASEAEQNPAAKVAPTPSKK